MHFIFESTKHRRITPEGIRRAIKETTFDVIESEFFNEFESIVNIRKIIDSFTKTKQYLSFNEISRILGETDFTFAIGSAEQIDVDRKIEFLYELGFLGILATPEIQDHWHVHHKHAFYFNEGDSLLKGSKDERFKQFTFVIHPLFTEYLQVDNSEQELVLEFTWDYLYDMESILFRR